MKKIIIFTLCIHGIFMSNNCMQSEKYSLEELSFSLMEHIISLEKRYEEQQKKIDLLKEHQQEAVDRYAFIFELLGKKLQDMDQRLQLLTNIVIQFVFSRPNSMEKNLQ